ncbi:DNA methyltransferase [Thiospirochaeta perfilievii]|uniref:DNA methyltransferase n=1 Tax=Thiospirochaeta perfilievii TaxID=252967 RepID=UPI001FEEFF21|nr:DNA methyltransferase [Thiospirochaeta perfilievii]
MNSNKELFTTKETAQVLGVSTSTIRRWSDDGILPCFRIGVSQYRKYEKSVVFSLKEKFYGKQEVSPEIKKKIEQKGMITKNIIAKSHPAHYLMHKYWGRKPHNVVNEYIACFTNEGDTVLEPFMGSGVTVIESLKLNRNVIGLDINPMSKFIVENTICSTDLDYFSKSYNEILLKAKSKYSELYDTRCPICSNISTIETAVWEDDNLVRIKGICPVHNKFVKDAGPEDFVKYEECSNLKQKLLTEGFLEYPTDEIMKYVKRSGRNRVDELFSDRALILLAYIRKLMLREENNGIKNLLLFCFTSMLSNVSRMLPGDKDKSTYKSGWVISKFWTPKIHTERNVFMCLDLRYKAIIKGKIELQDIPTELAQLYTYDSSNLDFIKDNSIDYIFTDPPYGESIAYLSLSHFWNSWLPDQVEYSREIIIDPYRQKDYQDYSKRSKAVFKELYRVLKDDHYMSFTFHNRDLNVWKAILDACYDAGFVLENVILQEQAVSSGTQGINRKNTLTGDFIYNFKKMQDKKLKQIIILMKVFLLLI